MKRNTLTLMALALSLVVAPAAAAQSSGAMRGEDNEFGSIRMPYTVDMNGERVPITAEVVIHNMYEQKDGRFYMFAFDAQRTPLDVTLDQVVRTDSGEVLSCYKSEGDAKQQKCFVDGRDLPKEGVPIVMHGTVGSSSTGTHTVGALVVAFTATWVKIPMSNGLDAELYAGTQVNVHEATGSGNGFLPDESKLPMPNGGAAFAIVAGVAVALGLAATRKRRS